MAKLEYLQLDEDSYVKPDPKEPVVNYEIAQIPSNWMSKNWIPALAIFGMALVIAGVETVHLIQTRSKKKDVLN